LSYASLADVQGLMAKFTLDGASKPTVTQATAIITMVDGEINSVLAAQGVAVPVGAPTTFVESLKALNAWGAAAAVLRSMFPKERGSSDTMPSEYALYQRWYERGLDRLKSGDGIPPEVASGSTVGPSTYFTRNPDEEEDLGLIAEPFFTRGKVF
jgi:hypothetical protein